MKKIVAIMMLMFCFFLVACGEKKEEVDAEKKEEKSEEKPEEK